MKLLGVEVETGFVDPLCSLRIYLDAM